MNIEPWHWLIVLTLIAVLFFGLGYLLLTIPSP
jgi:Sec-independent protein translocase protein TatA